MMNKNSLFLFGLMLILPIQGFCASITNKDTTTLFSNGNPAPNSYDFTGSNLHVSYTTTGIDGKPHLSYKSGKSMLNFKAEEIRTTETEIGTLVSVTTTMTVDTGSTSFSVLIPHVNLDAKLKSALKTQGFLTQHKFSMIPSFNTGQVENYKLYTLTGTAKFVVF